MKFWKSLKSSGGIWNPNGSRENSDSSSSEVNKLSSNTKHHEQNRKTNNSQLHKVRLPFVINNMQMGDMEISFIWISVREYYDIHLHRSKFLEVSQANNTPCHRPFHVHLRPRSLINELRLLNLIMEDYDGVDAGEERAIVVIIQLIQTTW